jgi:NAD(P)-dependent dehydrogenase (short-subunit alcohol dehydrogenase family)
MPQKPQTYLIVGASRGIGLAFVDELLERGHIVLATARSPESFSQNSARNLYSLTSKPTGRNLTILECDVQSDYMIKLFIEEIRKLSRPGHVLENRVIDVVIMNAGILEYPGRIGEM